MKKILSILAMAGILFMAMSCKTGSDDSTGNSGPDFTTINGTYYCETTIKQQKYTATIVFSNFENSTPDSKGKVKSEQSYPLRILDFTEDQIKEYKELLGEQYDDFIENIIQTSKDNSNKEFDCTIYTFAESKGSYGTDNYDDEDIIKLFNLDESDCIVLDVPKTVISENYYCAKKDDFSKIYMFTLGERTLTFNKIK